MQLVKYEAACRAVAEAKSIDEVKEIVSRAEAARAYAKQAKNRTLELDALEIRVRAERRLGEIIVAFKSEKLIRVGGPGRGRSDAPPITLKELGIDSNISGGAQRLAKLPESRFSSEITDWRLKAENALRVEVPLQRYRIPSIRGDREKAAARNGRSRLNPADPLDVYRSPDGRRVADWRCGELDRIKQLAIRVSRCVDAIQTALPVANPDPLDTVEMIFRDRALLCSVIASVWDKIPSGTAGVDDGRIAESQARRRRICARCAVEFVLKKVPHADRPTEGLYCSRACARRSSLKSCGT